MYIVVTKNKELIRDFETKKVTVFETKTDAETLASMMNGEVIFFTEQEIKFANKKKFRK